MKFLLLIAVTICIQGIQPVHSFAAEIGSIRIVAREDNAFVRRTATSLAELLQQANPGLEVELSTTPDSTTQSDAGKKLVVLIGERAFNTVESNGSQVLALVPQRVHADAERKSASLSAIYFEQPLSRLFNLALLLNPPRSRDGTHVIGIVASAETRKRLNSAQSLADERKLALHVETVINEFAVGKAIARVVEDAHTLVAIPDSVVHNANTVQPVLLLTYHAGVPVIGYSAAYLRAGAAVALYSSPEQLARQAVESIAAIRENKQLPATQWPRYFSVGVNSTVVRSLGISLPDAEVLEKRLASMKE